VDDDIESLFIVTLNNYNKAVNFCTIHSRKRPCASKV